MSNPKQNNLPPSLQDLTPHELFLFTGIPLHLLDGFISGKFKPNKSDREKLSVLSRKFFRKNNFEKRALIDREKYRSVRSFLSLAEKEELFNQPDKYNLKLNEFLKKYWDQILIAEAQS